MRGSAAALIWLSSRIGKPVTRAAGGATGLSVSRVALVATPRLSIAGRGRNDTLRAIGIGADGNSACTDGRTRGKASNPRASAEVAMPACAACSEATKIATVRSSDGIERQCVKLLQPYDQHPHQILGTAVQTIFPSMLMRAAGCQMDCQLVRPRAYPLHPSGFLNWSCLETYLSYLFTHGRS
jgi:hypothetical protein